MPCIDCFDNCTNGILTDKCIKYTGPDVPLLGICTGDSLFMIEAIILAKLQTLLDGSSITLSNVTLGCSFLTNLFGTQAKTLENLIQLLLDGECDLKASIDALDAIVFAPFSISAPCLTLPANPTRDQVLQAVGIKLCAIDTSVNAILADYVKDSQLCAKVNACLSAPTQFNTRMVPYIAYPYHGPLSNFDAGGIGISANGFAKVYICNGQNVGPFVTPDYRGRSPLGANIGIPGGALDSNVDPALPANAGYNITVGVKKGTYTDTLTLPQIPAHTHSVTDPGHTHNYTLGIDSSTGSANDNFAKLDSNTQTRTTQSSLTGISIGSAGSNQPHNSTHPSMGCNFIMYVP